MDLQYVLTSIKENNIEYIRLEVADPYGVGRCKIIPTRHFEERVRNGQNIGLPPMMAFDPTGGFIPGTGFVEEKNFGDSVCFPDLSTYTVLPWCKNTARVIVDATFDGKPIDAIPREIAKTQLSRLKELGYSILSAHEHEFYVVDSATKKPAFETRQWNATSRSNFNLDFTQQLGHDLPLAGVDIECIETEYNPGQMEIPYKPAFGIRAADNAYTYKVAIKEIAQQHNYIASFMTKPITSEAQGNGAHLNHSLWDADGKNNLLYDESSPTGLSTLAQHWMAGILAHGPAITLLHSPTINCIKRHQLDSWSPANTTWGFDNRSCLLRVKIAGPKGTYIENRLGSSAGSPYLSLAGMIIAGIDGIQRQLPLPKPVNGSAYVEKNVPSGTIRLPNNMKGWYPGVFGR